MASSMLLPDESTSICPNKKLTKIEGIDTSVTTDIILPTTTSDKTWEIGANIIDQPHYQPVKDYTYWSVLGSLKNWNIIQFFSQINSI